MPIQLFPVAQKCQRDTRRRHPILAGRTYHREIVFSIYSPMLYLISLSDTRPFGIAARQATVPNLVRSDGLKRAVIALRESFGAWD
jgi:hypothetical protein